jgi:signal transduction histidine kinase
MRPPRVARPLAAPDWVPLYVAAYVLFDWASFIRPVAGLNITPWNPQQALAVALLIWKPRAAWVAFAGLVAAELVVRGMPANAPLALAAAAALTVTFLLIAGALRRSLNLEHPLATGSELFRFVMIVTLGSLASALLYVLIRASGAATSAGLPALVAGYWIGDEVALLVTLPLLLLAMSPVRRAGAWQLLRSPVWWACALLACVAIAFVFARREQDYFKYFYLLLPPVVWAAVRFGVNGAVLASLLTQLGLVLGAQIALEHDVTLFELQVLMAATAITALLLGVAVDERARAEAELRAHLRFSAAGQMAAALAHELSQPVTALQNYAEACRMLADAPAPDGTLAPRLRDALAQLSAQAQRVGTVTRRLRDFFKSGSLTLQPSSLGALVGDTVDAHAELALRVGVRIDTQIEPDLPPLMLDPLQIALVLRNLVANAIDAASHAGEGRVEVGVRREASTVRVEVADSGPGVDASRLQTLFEGAGSSKQEGMGVGLRICRTIVEAHGGTLWATAGGRGRFGFTLPLHTPAHDRHDDE